MPAASGEGIGQLPAADTRAGGEAVRPRAIAYQLVDAPALFHHEVIGDQGPVAAPGDGLGAHYRGPQMPRLREQAPHAGAKLLRAHVVGVVAEAGVPSAGPRGRL